MAAAYKRIVLKLSGEGLAGAKGVGFDTEMVDGVAKVIRQLVEMGIQVGVVVGGGNIWRGRHTNAMNPVTADHMGMLATCINALCIQDALERLGLEAHTMTSVQMLNFAELYTRRDAVRHLENGAVVIFAGGTGNPHFTTDTAAALRAAEIGADAVFKGTTVDAVYDSDPRKNPNARPIKDITYRQTIEMGIQVMDVTAFALCSERDVKEIRIFSMDDPQNIVRVAQGEDLGTRVHA
ncbi:MAG TPA: UMP kinase [Candidatus Faecaligallichristensenella faecipullorum]|nr:UMP kinase [Candidatus Faecaligallichristensenella faecipullorum]